MPRVSVLMTTYNGAALIRESIDSILAQNFTDFELVVVDDGSTDETPAILASYADPRLRVARPPRNLGIVGARNFGFALCEGAYVAALDHDDLSAPDRLAVQVAYLDANPHVVLAGSEILISEQGTLRETDHEPGATPLLVRWMLHVDNPLTWSSVMFRGEAIRALGMFMNPEAELADDFELYHRLLRVGEIARLDARLAIYRWHAANTSHEGGERLLRAAAAVLARAYAPWLGAEAAEAGRLVAKHLSGREPPDAATLHRLGVLLERILAGFCRDRQLAGLARRLIETHAAKSWWRLARSSVRSGHPAAMAEYWRRPELRRGFAPSSRDALESLAVGTVRANALIRRMIVMLRG